MPKDAALRSCGSPGPPVREHSARFVIAAVLVAAVAGLFATAPVQGDFSWSDAPRHALNGAFIKDFVAAAPWHDPRGWAVDYYLQYPALTILFYPPLFYVFEAAAYALFGVSHAVAQATVSLFALLLGAATYALLRPTFPRWSSLGASLLVIGGPEIAQWGRQVMLDVPAYALVVTGVLFFARYLRAERPAALYLAVTAVLAAVYIKLNAAFIAPVLAIVLVIEKGPRVLRDRHALGAAALGAAGLVPALFLTLRYGAANMQSVTGRAADLPLTDIGAWLFYIERIPGYLGYVASALAACGIVLLVLRRFTPLEPWFARLLALWLGFGYLFFSAIGVREPRHGMMLAFPLVVFAIVALHRLLPGRLAPPAATGLGAATLLYSLVLDPVPAVHGYEKVADYIASHAPANAVIVFSGYRDGNFVFDLRTHEERRDISTIRADKLLLRIAVERARGVAQADLDEKQIAETLRELGVSLIAVQPGFWNDLQEMARFSSVLRSPDFEPVARFRITGAATPGEDTIEIYKPTYPVEQHPRKLLLEMPIIGQTFRGEVGSH